MEAEKFRASTDRIVAALGISLAELARRVGVDRRHIDSCRAGRRRPSDTLIVALRAVSASAPKLPEED